MHHSGGSKTAARPQCEYRNRLGLMIANRVEPQLRGTLYWICYLRDDSAMLSDFAQDAVQGNRCHMLDQELSNQRPTNPTAGQSSQGSTDVVVDRAAAQLARVQELVEHASAAYSNICPELTIVIPVYNEPETVIEIVQRVHRLPITKQIIVVNDGSTDTTGQSLDQLAYLDDVEIIEHDINRGKGAALQTGFQHARGKFVIVQDADLEYDPIDILKVIAPLRSDQSDVVYGSRYLERADQDPSRLHRFGNWLLTSFSNRMTGLKLTDMETCYKAFRRDVLNQIHVEQSRFGFEPEITAKIARQQVRIQEVGVSYNCRSWKEGKKIGVKDLINTLYCIVRYNWFKS